MKSRESVLACDLVDSQVNWQAGNPEERENRYEVNWQVGKLAKNCRAD